MRLSNVATFRLSKVMLDHTINSKRTIMRILKEVCVLQANRACILIKDLFDNMHNHIQNILKIIKSTNEKITRYIIRMFLISQQKTNKLKIYKWNNQILHILWTSYKKVFMKDNILRQYFITFFS